MVEQNDFGYRPNLRRGSNPIGGITIYGRLQVRHGWMEVMTMQNTRRVINIGNASRNSGVTQTNTRQKPDGC